MAVERRRDSPDAADAVRPLFDLIEVVLLHAVRRVGDDRVEAVFGQETQPLKAVCVDDAGAADDL
jgi:hypothetical protein